MIFFFFLIKLLFSNKVFLWTKFFCEILFTTVTTVTTVTIVTIVTTDTTVTT